MITSLEKITTTDSKQSKILEKKLQQLNKLFKVFLLCTIFSI